MLIQRATLLDHTTVDIRVGAWIEQVAENLAAERGESVLDAGGATRRRKRGISTRCVMKR